MCSEENWNTLSLLFPFSLSLFSRLFFFLFPSPFYGGAPALASIHIPISAKFVIVGMYGHTLGFTVAFKDQVDAPERGRGNHRIGIPGVTAKVLPFCNICFCSDILYYTSGTYTKCVFVVGAFSASEVVGLVILIPIIPTDTYL